MTKESTVDIQEIKEEYFGESISFSSSDEAKRKLLTSTINEIKENEFIDSEVTKRDLILNTTITKRDIPVNITYSNNVYTVYADLCGIKKENIKLELNGKTLKICAIRELYKSDALHENEIRTGNLLRLVNLESDIDGENVKAVYENGLLIVTLPKNEKNIGLRINID